jgi:hypothetical protein
LETQFRPFSSFKIFAETLVAGIAIKTAAAQHAANLVDINFTKISPEFFVPEK